MDIKRLKPIKILLYSCLFSAFISGCGDKTKSNIPRMPVSAVKITTSSIAIDKEYIGITQSISAVAIKARVEGFLDKMLFVEGAPVNQDQLLFVIDQKPFQAQLELAQGNLVKALADLEYQQVQYIRMKELIKKGDVSQSHYDEVAAQYKAAQGAVEANKGQVETAKINLGYCSMHAPFAGLIGKRYVDVGNLVGGSENTLLANVVQLDPMYVEFSPAVSDFGEFIKYRKNMPFKATAVFPKNTSLVFKGKVDLVNNEADTPTSTILMRAVVKNPHLLLRPGIYVNITLRLTDAAKAILVPSKAIMDVQGMRSVFIVNAKNQVEARRIVTEGQYQQQYYIVQSGLNVDDVVITDNLQIIRPGLEVDPKIEKPGEMANIESKKTIASTVVAGIDQND